MIESRTSNPNPLDEAIHANSPEEWSKVLGETEGVLDSELLGIGSSLRESMTDFHRVMGIILDPEEFTAFRLRMGLDRNGESRTFKEVGESMNFSRSTASRRYRKAVTRLGEFKSNPQSVLNRVFD